MDNATFIATAELPPILIKARDLVIDQYKELFLANGKEARPNLYVFLISGEGELQFETMKDVSSFHLTDLTKSILARVMDNIVAEDSDAPVNALVFVSEAWVANFRQKPDESKEEFKERFEGRLQPSQAPNKVESLVIVTRMRGKKTDTKIFEIDRVNKVLIPNEMIDGTVSGRFVDGKPIDFESVADIGSTSKRPNYKHSDFPGVPEGD